MSEIKGIVVTDSQGSTGSVTFWTLSGVVEFTKLEAAWRRAGLDPALLPPRTSPKTALRRAMDTLVTGQGSMVKAGSEPGWLGHFVRGKDAAGKPTFGMAVEACVAANPHHEPLLRTADGEPVEEGVADVIVLGYLRELRTIHHHDLSSWMVTSLRRANAVSLRESGGLYFLPAGFGLNEWRAMGEVLAEATHCRVFEIPAMASKMAAQAVLDALTREVREYVEGIDEQLGKVGSRALATRKTELAAYVGKLSVFEGVIGEKLEGLRAQIAAVEGKVAHAALAAMGAQAVADDAE